MQLQKKSPIKSNHDIFLMLIHGSLGVSSLGQRFEKVLGSGPNSLRLFLARGCLDVSGNLEEAIVGKAQSILVVPRFCCTLQSLR